MQRIEHQTFDEERALYGSCGIALEHCAFDGAADGESALKESRDISVTDCFCNLRYPFWHDQNLMLNRCELTELCRAALWYSQQITITDCKLHGIKALRECANVQITHCDIISPEFGWSTDGVTMRDTTAQSEYFMLRSQNLQFENIQFTGKYSFQYIENATFDHCDFTTKDAFWHGKHIVVRDSVIRGEYLAWYAEDLTFIHCKIIGTQPFCYCKSLRLIDCELLEADLCFEKSDVEATITTPVISIKNPRSGTIVVPAVEAIIMDDPQAQGEVIV